MRLRPSFLTLDFVRSLRRLAPFGEGNPEPVFLLEAAPVVEARSVGSDGSHLKLSLMLSDGRIVDAIGFSLSEKVPGLSIGDRVDTLCQLDENEWNGSVRIQLRLIDICRSGES